MSYGDYLDAALGGQTLHMGMFGGGKIVIINERSLERERDRGVEREAYLSSD